MYRETLLVDCSNCQASVGGTVVGSHEQYDEGAIEFKVRYALVTCPLCNHCVTVMQTREYDSEGTMDWDSRSERVWPDGESKLHNSIPRVVQFSLIEAQRCFRARAYCACAVMCGRAIEGMCRAHDCKGNLSEGLKILLDKNVIDDRLFEWGDSLRKERNIGAHATGIETSAMDARDSLDFAFAICEYVYVLTDRYERYKKRKDAQEAKVSESAAAPIESV